MDNRIAHILESHATSPVKGDAGIIHLVHIDSNLFVKRINIETIIQLEDWDLP